MGTPTTNNAIAAAHAGRRSKKGYIIMTKTRRTPAEALHNAITSITRTSPVWEVDYIDPEDGAGACMRIRAASAADAKRICKAHTGGLIADMRVSAKCGYAYRAIND